MGEERKEAQKCDVENNILRFKKCDLANPYGSKVKSQTLLSSLSRPTRAIKELSISKDKETRKSFRDRLFE